MKRKYWGIGLAIALLLAGCSSFHTCYETRTCAPNGGSGGSAGEAGDDWGEGGSSGADSGGSETGGIGGTGDASPAGAAGDEMSWAGSRESGGRCDPGYSDCDAGCTFVDGDPENCGGCNLKCPIGSVCKTGMCEVRVGYPNRFTGNDENAFRASANIISAVPIELSKRSSLVAFGFLNASTTAGAVATFGLYNDSGAQSPGALVASTSGVSLQGPAQEITTKEVILIPGTYYFAILPRDDDQPIIYASESATPTVNIWYSGSSSYQNGLPPSFGNLGAEAFAGHLLNVYLIVRQPGT